MKAPKVFVVAGPTSSGKSDFAVELALKVDGEIISADSRQIYRGLDIGTGKITVTEMRGVPHHMLDVVEPGATFSVAEYKRLALPLLEDILSRGKTPVICGGTGQYIDALIYDQTLPAVPPDPRLREELSYLSTDELVSKLRKLDMKRADSIDSHNRVRLIRAIEIATDFGMVPTLDSPVLRHPTEMYILEPSREVLRERILTRLHNRFEQGMIKEVESLLAEKKLTHEACEKLGLEYRYISRFLQGKLTQEEMVRQLEFKTAQYGKRQVTWLKKYPKDARIRLHTLEITK